MADLIGKWVVCAGIFTHEYTARQIVGETAEFWVMSKDTEGEPMRKRRKASTDIIAVYGDQQDAEDVTRLLNDRLRFLRDNYDQSVKNTIAAFRQHSGDENHD